MTAVARRASCSKETLYKWFGDRDGLLTATVQWQAAKVRVAPVDRAAARPRFAAREPRAVRRRLAVRDLDARPRSRSTGWRSAMPARGKTTDLGAIVLENGRFAIGRRLKPVLEAGRDAGLLAFDDTEDGVPHLLRAGRPRRADPAAARRPAGADQGRRSPATPQPRAAPVSRSLSVQPTAGRAMPALQHSNGKETDHARLLRSGCRSQPHQGQEGRHRRLWQPGQGACAQPQGFRRQGHRRRPQGRLGDGQEGRGRRAQGDVASPRPPNGPT